jgi:hypothetical protein
MKYGPPEAPEAQPVPSEADTATLPQQSAPEAPAAQQPTAAAPAAPAQEQPAAAAVPTPPNLVKPAKRGGLAGVMDEIADSLAGTQGPGKVFTDKEGNEYIEHPALSRKGQWLKIAAEAIHGAAAGAAAKPGPGQSGRALNAGLNASDEMEEKEHSRDTEQTQEVRQANQDHFNQIKLKHDMAAKEFELARMKVDASQHDIEFAQVQEDRMAKLVADGKAFDLGTYKDEADLARVKEQNPNFWKDVYKNNITAVPSIGPDGKRSGIHLFQTTPGVGNDPEEGLTFHVFQPPTKPGDKPSMKVQTASVPMSPNQAHAYDMAAYTQMQKWQTDQAEQELKASEVTRNNAQAAKDRADAAKTKQETAAGASDSLVQDILGGHVVPERLGYLLGKKEGQQLLERLSTAAHAQGVDLDIGKLQAYPKVYDQFASTKPGTAGFALNAGATALQHLAELEKLNTNSSRIPNTAASKAFLNKLDTVVPELIKFYGMPDTNNSVHALKSSMGGFFNRGAAIKQQAKSMGDKIQNYEQQWKNAAPSKFYEAPMPGLSDKAKMARAELDPDYAKRLFSVSKWKAVNPNGDAVAARKQALAQQFDVIE